MIIPVVRLHTKKHKFMIALSFESSLLWIGQKNNRRVYCPISILYEKGNLSFVFLLVILTFWFKEREQNELSKTVEEIH